MNDYQSWFGLISGRGDAPHAWQAELGLHGVCENRLIRIPTGFGKTLGVLAAWLRHRVVLGDDAWPRRLVWCLPMRTLVEQTRAEAEAACRRANVLWDGVGEPAGRVGVHTLMGGVDAGEWHLWPEEPAILIGTQDMLLSRALNRGYGSGRARWPMEFGLLGQDCLWVMDEIQLMDVGLATSAQLQAFREQDRSEGKSVRPCSTWWMSATLQRNWLRSVDTEGWIEQAPSSFIPGEAREGKLWEVSKVCEVRADLSDPVKVGEEVLRSHKAGGAGKDGPTLVVVNTVDRAVAVAEAIRKHKTREQTDVRLVHSRFRGRERAGWRTEFLCREACDAGTDRIVVATQVVEAGVDFSSARLFTDIAPWASMVQRFGRVARWGGHAHVVVVDTKPADDSSAAPYGKDEIDAARTALERLADVSPRSLEEFEEGCGAEVLAGLYPYDPAHVLLRHELEELFDTSPDLSGADVDVSRFIRSGDERDVSVFWDRIPEKGLPNQDLRPSRDALCSVPFLRARDWLCGKETKTKRSPRLTKRRSAWVWNWMDGSWKEAERRDLYPGQTVLVDACLGGYDWDDETHRGLGWKADHHGQVTVVEKAAEIPAGEHADAAQDDESLSLHRYRTIATHVNDVAQVVRAIADKVACPRADLLALAGLWHDVGKAHAAMQGSIRAADRPSRQDLAKAPKDAWPRAALYQMATGQRRPGFRHELASTLALFAVLQRHRPDHPALLGPWRDLLAELGAVAEPPPEAGAGPSAAEQAILGLDAADFDFLAYLVCSHHGKVRGTWHASPADQANLDAGGELTIRGVRSGDALRVRLGSGGREECEWTLDLAPSAAGLSERTGMSWTERVLKLQRRHGPFTLAWFEALLRAADQRASRIVAMDPLLAAETDR